MPRPPRVSGREVVRALEKAAFKQVQQRASHVVMRKGSLGRVVPLHDELTMGTLLSVLKQAGMTLEDFRKLLK